MKILFIVILFSSATAFGQQRTPEMFKTFNRTVSIVNEEGSAVVKLNEAEGPGIAWIKGEQSKDGVIEFDIKGRDLLQQSFVGLAFHGINDTTYEAVYFRPFNFKTTDPVRKLHAVQYIANPQFDWPKLRADFPNQYEKPVIPIPDPNKWFHVRLEIKGRKISVFVNGNTLPALAIERLVDSGGQMIGYWVGNGSAGNWKNLNITAIK
ncbi:hypothetical protein [Mucilaginibacter lappiensis]|uniref:hypothetical protein n=1 Tax=Mucilaginibacter lappiensis TaxID=354630 RepID=UPI003D20FE05